MKTLEEKIAVMTAALEGKEIQWYDGILWVGCDGDVEYDWQHYDYRIKPEEHKPEYVPYESAEEFLQAQKEHGLYITEKERKYETCVMMVFESGIHIYDFQKSTPSVIHFIELFYKYTWQNGTPCGKLKQ